MDNVRNSSMSVLVNADNVAIDPMLSMIVPEFSWSHWIILLLFWMVLILVLILVVAVLMLFVMVEILLLWMFLFILVVSTLLGVALLIAFTALTATWDDDDDAADDDELEFKLEAE
jgi:hypothetical protein